MLFLFRFFQGTAGCCVLTNGGGTIADLFKQEECGSAMAIWGIGILIGPVAGGFLSQSEGWRWIFWVIAIVSGVLSVPLLFAPETYAPRIAQLQGNIRYTSNGAAQSTAVFHRAIFRPFQMLRQPIVLLISLYNAVVYGYLYLLFTTFNSTFQGVYHFSIGISGLAYLGIGVSMFLSLVILDIISDRILKAKSVAGGLVSHAIDQDGTHHMTWGTYSR